MDSFRLTPLAVKDLEDIWSYTFEVWGVKQADSYISDLMKAIERLANGERKGRKVSIRSGYLKYQSGKHLIFFRIEETQVQVIRILHQSMDNERHL